GIYYSSNHTLIWNINSLNVSKSKILNISVLVKNTVPNGTIINNSAIVSLPGFYNETNQSTTVLAAEIYDPKTVIDLNGPPSQPGDVLEYSIWLNNTGVVDTTAFFVDPIPEHTTYANYVWASSGNVSYNASNNSIEWHGNIPAGSYVNVRFRVKIDAPLPDNTIISNQGTVYYDSNNDSIIDAEKPTDDPTTNQPYDPTNITVKNPKITLTKTATTAEYGKKITFTIKLCVEGFATNITLVEHYPKRFQFVEATPKPTKSNNIWKFKKLQDECIEIKITMYIPTPTFEYESKSEVVGKGIVLTSRKISTDLKPYKTKNTVVLTCDQGINIQKSVEILVKSKKGNFAETSECGIGNYSVKSEVKVKKDIYLKRELLLKSNSSVGWSAKECLRDANNNYIERRIEGNYINYRSDCRASYPKLYSTAAINGSLKTKVKHTFTMYEKYLGNFTSEERLDSRANIRVEGDGLVVFEEGSQCHKMMEHGDGNYTTKMYFNKEKVYYKETNANAKANKTEWYQKVCFYNKKCGEAYISSTVGGKNISTSVKGELCKQSSSTYSKVNKTITLKKNRTEYLLKTTFEGYGKIHANIGGYEGYEWYIGNFTIYKEIEYLDVNKTEKTKEGDTLKCDSEFPKKKNKDPLCCDWK
ncbi:MAG: DUF11 domain-containing protein, partial [Archaeoglobaceae archaeon]|nr:DUF11 domain-containing protein [Archaeoglobaceae archaeon]